MVGAENGTVSYQNTESRPKVEADGEGITQTPDAVTIELPKVRN